MAKPTSLAAQLKRDDEAEKLADEKADLAALGQPTEEGKVWVRLVRMHYDAQGVMHMPGLVQLFKDSVPDSAKVLSTTEAKSAFEVDED